MMLIGIKWKKHRELSPFSLPEKDCSEGSGGEKKHCDGEKIAAQKCFKCNGEVFKLFGALFIASSVNYELLYK